MKRFAFMLLALALVCAVAWAQDKIAVVDTDNEPVVGAAVFNSQGRIIVVSDHDGMFDTPDGSQFPLSIRALGLKEVVVAEPAEVVTMEVNPLSLAEVTISPDEHPILKLTCLLKESSGVMTSSDTTKINSEYMVEFYLPMRKVKKFDAVRSPLVRNARCEYRSTSAEPVDTADVVSTISFKSLVHLDYKEREEAESLKGATTGNDTTFAKKTGKPQIVNRKSPAGYSTRVDGIANETSGIISPAIFKLFGLTMDLTEMLMQTSYEPSETGKHSEADMSGQSLSMKAVGRGKLIKKAFKTKDDIDIYAYLELIPLDRAYLTVDDAREQSRDKYRLPFPDKK